MIIIGWIALVTAITLTIAVAALIVYAAAQMLEIISTTKKNEDD